MAIRSKPAPDVMYVSLTSFMHRSSVTNRDEIIRDDTRLLGSHAAVQAHPELFIRAGEDDETIARARQAILNRATGAAR